MKLLALFNAAAVVAVSALLLLREPAPSPATTPVAAPTNAAPATTVPVLRASKIELVRPDGTEAGYIAALDNGMTAFVALDAQARARLMLGVEPGGTPFITLNDDAKATRLMLAVDASGDPLVGMMDPKQRPRGGMSLNGPLASLWVGDDMNSPRASLSSDVEGGRVDVFDAKKLPRATLGAHDTGSAVLQFWDANGLPVNSYSDASLVHAFDALTHAVKVARAAEAPVVLPPNIAPEPESQRTEPNNAGTSPRATSWGRVGTWSGSGPKQTAMFDVASGEWRLEWTAKDAAGAGYVGIAVYNESGALVAMPVNQASGGSDTSYVHAKPGRYYLDINAANVEWTVTVEDQR
ncbi:MAG TPA: hypothetical protein VK824_08555 [Planctomycetota bacterium]|nr:hypothetical protein [Planctomycetota bacterium]